MRLLLEVDPSESRSLWKGSLILRDYRGELRYDGEVLRQHVRRLTVVRRCAAIQVLDLG